jgi:acetoacetyl-CoA synthetase
LMKPLWTPSAARIENANLTKFTEFVNEGHRANIASYSELYDWSITQPQEFWGAAWDFTGVVSSKKYDRVVDDFERFPGAKWFPGARLNFAENLLRHDDDHIAVITRSEDGARSQLTHSELRQLVGRLANSFRQMGVLAGDRVVGYLPNVKETLVSMLATTSIGGVWASCGPDLGASAVIDRLAQVEPKVLVAVESYEYKGRRFDILPNVEKVSAGIRSLQRTVISTLDGSQAVRNIPNAVRYQDLVGAETPPVLRFEQLPSEHPVYIMFSSGTTGKPKCIVQGIAGVLVNHLKEIILHADLRNTDRILYITSPSWMMWNWLMSCLAVGASVVLHDGNPNHPDWGAIWKIVAEEKISVLGCSASYINYLRNVGARPGQKYDLSSLREISQTGSPLSSEGFEWVYMEVKPELHLNSISGGTDINGCFAAGVPTLPVYAGELQGPGLGMKIDAYDENANSVRDRLGELVCEAPTPSMPLFFWNDPDGERYREAYFDYYKPQGKTVWRHGDFVVFHTHTGGITFLGRSDAVLKASGIRIGTSEIYNVVEKFPEVADSLAVGQNWKSDQRIILFVKPVKGQQVSDALRDRIRTAIRTEASPKHVPAMILEAPDIPYTFNMKKVEVAVANILNGRPVTNRDALVNPESLDFFVELAARLGTG